MKRCLSCYFFDERKCSVFIFWNKEKKCLWLNINNSNVKFLMSLLNFRKIFRKPFTILIESMRRIKVNNTGSKNFRHLYNLINHFWSNTTFVCGNTHNWHIEFTRKRMYIFCILCIEIQRIEIKTDSIILRFSGKRENLMETISSQRRCRE